MNPPSPVTRTLTPPRYRRLRPIRPVQQRRDELAAPALEAGRLPLRAAVGASPCLLAEAELELARKSSCLSRSAAFAARQPRLSACRLIWIYPGRDRWQVPNSSVPTVGERRRRRGPLPLPLGEQRREPHAHGWSDRQCPRGNDQRALRHHGAELTRSVPGDDASSYPAAGPPARRAADDGADAPTAPASASSSAEAAPPAAAG
jgi:hypothetical protein